MAETSREDRAGTFWDWPVGLIVGGLVITLFTYARWLGVLLVAFGVVALLVRRGAFASRRR